MPQAGELHEKRALREEERRNVQEQKGEGRKNRRGVFATSGRRGHLYKTELGSYASLVVRWTSQAAKNWGPMTTAMSIWGRMAGATDGQQHQGAGGQVLRAL